MSAKRLQQRGALLIAAVVLIVVIGVLASTLSFLYVGSTTSGGDHLSSAKALFVAESGLEHAAYQLKSGTACASLAPTQQTVGEGNFSTTVAANSASSTLTSAISATATVIPLSSTTNFGAHGRITIGSEAINYAAISGLNLTGAKRGRMETTEDNHLSGTAVTQDQCMVTSTGTVGVAQRVLEGSKVPTAPLFQAAGTAVAWTGTGDTAVAWPTTHAVNDIALLFVESAGGQAATLPVVAGFSSVLNSPQATGETTAGTRITVFWARATSTTMPNQSVTIDTGDHGYAQIITYRGVINTGNPWDVTGGNVKATATTAVTVSGITTTVPDTLVVQAVARDNDLADAAFSAQTNANLTGITERSDAGTAEGNGGGFAVWDGVKATAGATGDTTATVTSSINAFLTIALKPPATYSREREWGYWREVYP